MSPCFIRSLPLKNKVLPASEVSKGTFREDLFFRLNVFPLRLKPLRERQKYLPAITEYLVSIISARIGKRISRISEKNMEKVLSNPWPGNVRELKNVLERAVILSKGEELDMTKVLVSDRPQKERFSGKLVDMEKRAIEDALEQTGGNRKQAADVLDISLRALQYKIKEYGIKK